MNAVRDFLNDPVRMDEKLAFAAKIRTSSGFLVNTAGPCWVTPPRYSNMDWSVDRGLGGLFRVHQAYAATLLGGRSEATADNFFHSVILVSKFNGWRGLASKWLTQGEIDFPAMLALKQGLFDANPRTGSDDFGTIRRWYYWAHGLHIPGFIDATVDRLKALKNKKKASFMAQEQIAPGRSKSKATENRRCYTDVDFARIQSALLRLEGRLNKGEIILSTGREFSSLRPNIQVAVLQHSLHIGIRHLTLGWFACVFGDRPKAFSELRENDFTFIEADGVKVGTVRFSDEIKGGFGRLTKPSKRASLPLNADLVRLIPMLLQENRIWAANNGINPDCNLPLFPANRTKRVRSIGLRMTVEDEGARFIKLSNNLNFILKTLFKVLNVKAFDGTPIKPTFYSFRDGNHTRWSRKMPLESVRAITGKKGIRSFKNYTKPGIRHIARLDEVTEYIELAEYLKPPVSVDGIEPKARIPSPFPYVEDGELRVGVEGGCGCFGSSCPMAFDGSADCYICHAFTPAVEGPHEQTLKILLDRKTDMIARGLPKSEWTRYDRHIAAVGLVVRLVQEWRRKHLDRENP